MQISVFNGWLSACLSGWRTVDFFHRYGYSTVAIYGMGLLGRQLYEELAESDLQVLYYIDRAEIPGADTVPRVMPEAEAGGGLYCDHCRVEFERHFMIWRGKRAAEPS